MRAGFRTSFLLANETVSLLYMRFTLEIDRETDGRWIAEIPDLPGVMVYSATRQEALARAKALALRVIADRLEHGEALPEFSDISFIIPAA
jgi:predicted RNase H-like HicB family nuclease